MPSPVTRALNLRQAGIFRLLVVTTALLGGVIALGAASACMLQGLYKEWQLNRSHSITVYLPPEAEPAAVTQLTQSLAALSGVTSATQVPAVQLQQALQPLVSNTENLPLPTVLNVTFREDTPLEPIGSSIRQNFPTAEIDDHQPVLKDVGGAVRGLQTAALGLSVVMLALMALLITLTTRTGLQAEAFTLHLLVQLGSTDATLTRVVTAQVLARTLAGYALGSGVAAVLLAAAVRLSPALAAHAGWPVWAALFASPLLLPAIAALTATLVTNRLLARLT